MKNEKLEMATLGGGCFWCIEAIFQEINGVEKVVSGYSGGYVSGSSTPTYKEVCSGLTGHVEVVQISFDINVISYEEILVIFMTTHDPTTLNQQGADRGTQYRSVIYYHNETQMKIAEFVSKEISTYYEYPIVTEIEELGIFHKAEEEHQAYYKNHQDQGYCSFVITPKLVKLRKLHCDKLKKTMI